MTSWLKPEVSGHFLLEEQGVLNIKPACRGLTFGGPTLGWMEERTQSTVGSLDREKDCVMTDTHEVGPCWAVSAADGSQQSPRKTPTSRVFLLPPGGQVETWARKCHITVRFCFCFSFCTFFSFYTLGNI